MKRKKSRAGNILLALLCLLLIAALGALWYWNRQEEQERQRELQETISGQTSDEASDEASGETSEEMTAETSDDASDDADAQEETSEEEEETDGTSDEDTETVTEENAEGTADPAVTEEAQDTETAQEEVQTTGFTGISLRGDCFIDEDEKGTSGYGKKLYDLIKEQYPSFGRIIDYGMDHSGTMSQMRLAGVDEDTIQGYLNSHLEEHDESELTLTEKKVRELTEEELYREDKAMLPVLCMGYYGGWNKDPQELVEHINLILATYDQQESYIVAGLYPSGVEDREAYRSAMTEAFGDHYIQLDDTMRESAGTDAGKQEIAEALFDKIVEMGYLEAE